jgi:hypothetical protein
MRLKRMSRVRKPSFRILGVPLFMGIAMIFVCAQLAWCTATGSISGVVRDPSNAAVPGCEVVALNTGTGIKRTVSTNAQGFYLFEALPLGTYEVEVNKAGFKRYRETGLVVNVNSALVVDARLEVGEIRQQVSVSSTAVHVDTASTRMGEVITGATMTAVPLNGRSYVDLLALQPGVTPEASTQGSSEFGEVAGYGETSAPFQSSNFSAAGNLAINGNQETSNAFMVNGALVDDVVQQGTTIVPNLDSIAEFRILTNGYQAEYGNYGGGQINIVTKSGTDQFHGDAFEFVRNTSLDARNFFSSSIGPYHQNQFGGTLGGPILRHKLFFFGDYQGTRQVIGVDTGDIAVPSVQDRSGNLSDIAASLTGTVNGAGWAGVLSQRLGYAVTDREPYYTTGCTTSAQCVFPNAIIPMMAWDSPASKLMGFIPSPNVGSNFFSTSANKQTFDDNETSYRVDGQSRWGMLSGYYYYDKNSLNNPYAEDRAPGFSGLGAQDTQLATFGDTKSFGSTMVNELHLNYLRVYNSSFVPVGGLGPKISSFGITEGCQTLGICVLLPQFEGVPPISFNNFNIGIAHHDATFIQNTYQGMDNFSKVVGTHTLIFGGEFHIDQLTEYHVNNANGAFSFNGGETGSDFADFLLGAPIVYDQGISLNSYNRSRYYGLFGQDAWRATSNLTVNYGLRWEVSYPWYQKNNNLETVWPGKQSVAFPGAPPGWVIPGDDPFVPNTTSPVEWDKFAPRFGFAYAPKPQGGFLRTLLGGPGESSIRGSWGLFYSQMGELGDAPAIGDAPFGFFWVSEAPPMFDQPFLARATQTTETQRFPVALPPGNVSASNPDTSINWANFEPIQSSPGWYHGNVMPYSENYSFSIERQLGSNTLVTLAYAGSEGHHLLVTVESNPSNPALCLSLSQPSEVAPGTATCGPYAENGVFATASGQMATVRPLAPGLGSDGLYTTMGNSSYNALEASLKHQSGRMTFLASYTYSKALDEGSSEVDQVNPFNYRLSKGLSAYDMTHNFVFSYRSELPFDKLFGTNRATRGWILSGITRFTTGLPVTVQDTSDIALIGNNNVGNTGSTTDEPNIAPGKILANTNPRSGLPYFNISLFSQEALGQVGNANRRFFHGPGINNFDMALLKDLHLTESKSLEFRAEFFNIFNHANFNNPEGEFLDSTFGLVTSAQSPRIGQLAVKFIF